MPKEKSIKKVMVIGSGPIVIGQAAEFDYAGAQACTILKRENEEQIAAFLGDHPEYRAESFSLPGGLAAPEGMLTLLPSVHDTDGFFIAKLRRMP